MRLFLVLRSLVATVYALMATAMVALYIVLTSIFTKNMRIHDWAVRLWGASCMWVFNVHIHVVGKENIPKGGCLFVFNHTSHFDILIISAILQKPARFGAKTELFRIPLFGRAMAASGALEIFRADRDRVLELYKSSISRVYAGESFILAAEGTRQTTPGVGAKFKGGPFIFAIGGQFAISPLVLKGAAECLPKGDLLACTRQWRHDVTVTVLPPVVTAGYTVEQRQILQNQAQKAMTSAYLNS